MARSFAIFTCLATLAFVACSGKVSSSASGADGGPGNVDDSKNDPPAGPQGALVAACPSNEPTLGASCSPLGQLCEYGGDVSSQCNFIAHCSPEGAWESVSDGSCGTLLSTCGDGVTDDTPCYAGNVPCTIATGICTCFDHSTGPVRIDDGGPPVPDPYA
ncbi:MAG: hypothetical protein ACREJX_18605, partial [Polyangiaceae bacterium]